MKKYTLILSILGLLCLTNQYALGQISVGGTPMSFSLNVVDSEKERIPVKTMSTVDAKTLILEDKNARTEDGLRPSRFGYALDVAIDIKRDGIKKELPNGDKLWLLKIHSSDAYSINLIFDRFYLSEGSTFFIYNENRTMIQGAFTPEVSNNPDNVFATDLVQGNTIILEYYEPQGSDDGVIHIGKVIHGYVNIFAYASAGLGLSASCNVDVNCPLGNDWRDQQRSVVMLLVNENTAFCSGVLVNNTSQDLTPYILTARHCYFNNNGNTQTRDPATNIFRFQYWRPNCNSGTPITTRSIIGATLLAHYAPTDFALLRLNSMPPKFWNVYYAGWDRSTTPAQNATGIHHPRGDAMKISHEKHSVIAQNIQMPGRIISCWAVRHFEDGTVQGGSSGSPLFNPNRRIIGQLSVLIECGTDNTCACNNREAYYGRFDLSWTGGGTNATRLSNWLDPIGNNAFALYGSASFYCVNLVPWCEGSCVVCVPCRWCGCCNHCGPCGSCSTCNQPPPPPKCFFGTNWCPGPGHPNSCSQCNQPQFVCARCFETGPFPLCCECRFCGSLDPCPCALPRSAPATPSSIAYPNPTGETLIIDMNRLACTAGCCTNTTYSIRLYDAQGNVVRQQVNARNNSVEFDVSRLPEGTYYLHIEGGDKLRKEQIVVRR